MNAEADRERWRCKYCGTYKPVTTLARDCEKRHEEEWGTESP